MSGKRNPPKGPCSVCGGDLQGWAYRYRGDAYCRGCYKRHFRLKTCAVCGKKKRIHRDLPVPVCKICQIREKPCVRCRREIVRPGLITPHGPVCASCTRYFRDPERCPVCGEEKRDVFARSAFEGSPRMCERCHHARLPICSVCGRRKRGCATDASGRTVCPACAKGPRKCRECGGDIPGGRGRICPVCSARNGLGTKTRFAAGALEGETRKAFLAFSDWFDRTRGPQKASMKLLKYLPFFMVLGEMEKEMGRLPLYVELAGRLGVMEIWKNRLAMSYLDESGLVAKDAKAQEEIADLDMIDRMLRSLPEKSAFGEYLHAYHALLEKKLVAGKTKTKSVRLAMTPAARFLRYCLYMGAERPGRELLEGYLWIFPGQKSALTGFANFLDRRHGTALSIGNMARPELSPPNSSSPYLRQRLTAAMREKSLLYTMGIDGFLRVAIGYLHRVDVPKNVGLGFCFTGAKKPRRSLKMAGGEYYLPEEIVEICRRFADGEIT